MKSFQDQPALVLALLEVKKGNVKKYSFGLLMMISSKVIDEVIDEVRQGMACQEVEFNFSNRCDSVIL